MHPLSRFLLLLTTVNLLAGAPSPQSSRPPESDDAHRILAAERAWAQSAVEHNTARMATFMADDYVELTLAADPATHNLRWKSTNKSEWLALIQSGEEKYDSVDLRDLKVYLHGDVATVTGEYTQKGTRAGEDISATGSYVDTWIKKKGRWQVASSVFP